MLPFSGSLSLLLLQPQLSSLSVIVACSAHSMTARQLAALPLPQLRLQQQVLFPHQVDSPAFCLLPSQTTPQKVGKERPYGDGSNAAVPGTMQRAL